jgi:hypothetical protein
MLFASTLSQGGAAMAAQIRRVGCTMDRSRLCVFAAPAIRVTAVRPLRPPWCCVGSSNDNRRLVERRMEVPELAFGVACAVFAYAVGLVDGFLQDDGAGLHTAGIVRVGVVDRYHRHASDRSQ